MSLAQDGLVEQEYKGVGVGLPSLQVYLIFMQKCFTEYAFVN